MARCRHPTQVGKDESVTDGHLQLLEAVERPVSHWRNQAEASRAVGRRHHTEGGQIVECKSFKLSPSSPSFIWHVNTNQPWLSSAATKVPNGARQQLAFRVSVVAGLASDTSLHAWQQHPTEEIVSQMEGKAREISLFRIFTRRIYVFWFLVSSLSTPTGSNFEESNERKSHG